MISLNKVYKSYDGAPVVTELTLEVPEGELLVLLGESGCGKTTTLKMINRLIEPSAGTIEVDGSDVLEHDPVHLRRSIGYVFQGVGLFPHMTVAENVAVVPRLLRWAQEEIDRRTEELLCLVGLEGMGARRPSQLSGGQRQRVGVARALAARPKILLMDEPFGALDPLTRDALQEEFREIHRELGLTTVLVTHDMLEALLLADRIAVMRDGRVLQLGEPAALLSEPAGDYVRRLMEKPLQHAGAVEALARRAREARDE